MASTKENATVIPISAFSFFAAASFDNSFFFALVSSSSSSKKDAEYVSVDIPSVKDSTKLNTPRKIGMFRNVLFLISP